MTYVLDPAPLSEPVCDPFYDWNALGEAIEQHGRDIAAARAAHRADCLKRYGRDIFARPVENER